MLEPPIVVPSAYVRPAAIRGSIPVWLGYSNLVACMWMSGACVVLLLSSVLRVGNGREVWLPGASIALPESCFAYRQFGVDCPGCGLTRAFVHLAHGDMQQAIAVNPMGLAVFVFTLLQIPFGFSQLIWRCRNSIVAHWQVWNERAIAGLVIGLLVQWLVRLTP